MEEEERGGWRQAPATCSNQLHNIHACIYQGSVMNDQHTRTLMTAAKKHDTSYNIGCGQPATFNKLL